jgi:hypothetical protein
MRCCSIREGGQWWRFFILVPLLTARVRKNHSICSTSFSLQRTNADEYVELWVRPTICHDFFFQWLYSPFLGPGLIFQFLDLFTQTVGLLGRVISQSQGLYLYTGQHKHRKTHKHINIHASSRIRTYDHGGIRASEDSSCLRPLCYRDRHSMSR